MTPGSQEDASFRHVKTGGIALLHWSCVGNGRHGTDERPAESLDTTLAIVSLDSSTDGPKSHVRLKTHPPPCVMVLA